VIGRLFLALCAVSIASILIVGCPVTTHGPWQPMKPPAVYTTNVRRRR
jgi:hypothetical protein